MPDPSENCLLPLPLPDGRVERAILFAVRRMAARGLRDVNAAWLMIDLYSVNFRRPLVLLRAFVLELTHISQAAIRVAPCCAPRMTHDEGLIMAVLTGAQDDPVAAQAALVELTRTPRIGEPLSAASVFARVAAELAPGQPRMPQPRALTAPLGRTPVRDPRSRPADPPARH